MNPLKTLALSSLFLLLPASMVRTRAQTGSPLFQADGPAYLPRLFEPTSASVTGDFDGDGDTDIIVSSLIAGSAVFKYPVRLYLNDGYGVFHDVTASRMPNLKTRATSLAAGDVDKDGDLDLVVGVYGSIALKTQNLLFLNQGKGYFKDVSTSNLPQVYGGTYAVELSDVDKDGDLDLVLGIGAYPNALLLNDGKGRFSKAPYTMMPGTRSSTRAIALADLDGDGDLDLVTGNMLDPSRVYFNDGKGTFRSIPGRFPTARARTIGVFTRDFDRDGDIDILLANTGAVSRLFLNDGKGYFKDATASHMPSKSYNLTCMDAGDIDGDGDTDLVFASFYRDTYMARRAKGVVYLNDGKGIFHESTAPGTAFSWEIVSALRLADLDKDGDLDLLAWGEEVDDRLLLNDGKGRFLDLSAGILGSQRRWTMGASVGDFDGNGDPDLLTLDYKLPSRLLLNDGYGLFRQAPPSSLPPLQAPISVVPGDLDGDGDLDLLVGRYGPPRVLLNDGKAAFRDVSSTSLPPVSFGSAAIALGDLDGDGDLDFLACTKSYMYHLVLLLNRGKAKFTEATSSNLPGTGFKGYPSLLDADGDGDLDVFLQTKSQPRLFLNDGKGKFTDMTFPLLPSRISPPATSAFGDVDNDGDVDIVLPEYPQPVLYLNGGKGKFSLAPLKRIPALSGYPTSVLLADMDEDGDLDLLFGCRGSGPEAGKNVFLANDGTGTFTLLKNAMPGLADSTALLLPADLDRDGDLDLFVGNNPGGDPGRDRIYWNLTRQVDFSRVPRLGFPLSVDFHSRLSAGKTRLAVLPLVSLARTRIPIPPFGAFGLDPITLVGLPLLSTAPSTARVTMDLQVPRDPVLTGWSLYFQGLVEGRKGGRPTFRFTNVKGGKILGF